MKIGSCAWLALLAFVVLCLMILVVQSRDVDSDGLEDEVDPDDDNDGILDPEDPDDDNDGILDIGKVFLHSLNANLIF